ncbi:MAG: helix-turn-helix transcriptional regulator [Eggerthellaceae bacterium]|nr:helix-turn-helix transcriptional regulator [Eggerthellaceae bacterium]
MAMKVSREEFLGIDEPLKPNFENVAAKMALDFEADVFMRLKELGLKRKDLARLLNVSPAAVSKLLTENSNMTLKTMAKIATALGCEISPFHLNGVAEVSYVDFDADSETDTVIVPNEVISALGLTASIGDDVPASGSTQVVSNAKPVPVAVFRRVAA